VLASGCIPLSRPDFPAGGVEQRSHAARDRFDIRLRANQNRDEDEYKT
jgi:hypothetical protein